MNRRYSYFYSRIAVEVTGIMFLVQIIAESVGDRRPGFEWIIPVCGGAFAISICYAICLILLNARNGCNKKYD